VPIHIMRAVRFITAATRANSRLEAAAGLVYSGLWSQRSASRRISEPILSHCERGSGYVAASAGVLSYLAGWAAHGSVPGAFCADEPCHA